MRGPHHSKAVIEAQERLQHVLLVPEPQVLHHPAPRVVRGQEDVVHVHEHAGGQTRDHFGEQEAHVAAHVEHVRGIDEQDVAGLQAGERLHRSPLHLGRVKADATVA